MNYFQAENMMGSNGDPLSNSTDGVSNAREESGNAFDHAHEAAAKLASAAKAAASDFAGSASDFADHAAESFKSGVEYQKTTGAGAVGDAARAAKGAADNFQDGAPELAEAVRTVAGRVESISDDIRDRSVNELLASVADFAAQKPVALFGCGILAGLVISRLLGASNR